MIMHKQRHGMTGSRTRGMNYTPREDRTVPGLVDGVQSESFTVRSRSVLNVETYPIG